MTHNDEWKCKRHARAGTSRALCASEAHLENVNGNKLDVKIEFYLHITRACGEI